MRTLLLSMVVGMFMLALPGRVHPAAKTVQGTVNINAASASELQLLPGIGPAKAERIVEYRRLRPFRTVEELARVKGIGPKTVKKLRQHLSVKGETTAGTPAAAPGGAGPPASAPVPRSPTQPTVN